MPILHPPQHTRRLHPRSHYPMEPLPTLPPPHSPHLSPCRWALRRAAPLGAVSTACSQPPATSPANVCDKNGNVTGNDSGNISGKNGNNLNHTPQPPTPAKPRKITHSTHSTRTTKSKSRQKRQKTGNISGKKSANIPATTSSSRNATHYTSCHMHAHLSPPASHESKTRKSAIPDTHVPLTCRGTADGVQ
jgi:hypothetical protein